MPTTVFVSLILTGLCLVSVIAVASCMALWEKLRTTASRIVVNRIELTGLGSIAGALVFFFLAVIGWAVVIIEQMVALA